MRPEEFVEAARTRWGKAETGVLSKWFRLVGMAEEVFVRGCAEDGGPTADGEKVEDVLGGGGGRTDGVVLGLCDGGHGSCGFGVMEL